MKAFFVVLSLAVSVKGWVSPNVAKIQKEILRVPTALSAGALHGEQNCFLPLEQCDNEYTAPRIIQVRLRKQILPPIFTCISF
jgi:hypothetical protein